MTTKITPPPGALPTPGSFDTFGLWVPTPAGRATPPSPQLMAVARARALAVHAAPAHQLQPCTVAPGVIELRSEPIPQATPPADLAERIEEHRAAMALEEELAALGGER